VLEEAERRSVQRQHDQRTHGNRGINAHEHPC
jgi:hypothetical protein